MVNPSRIAFEIFGRPIYWYGVLMAVGIACAVVFTLIEAMRKDVDEDTVLDLCLVAIPSGVIGARVYYVLFELGRYLQDPIRIFYIWEGGLAIYGAVLGGALGVFIYTRIKKIRFLKIADLIAPGLVFAQAIGRWGNFFNQEAYGLPVENTSMLWFPFSVKIDGAHYFDFGDGLGSVFCANPYHLATFFYESMWCILVFLFLWFFLRKRSRHDGDVLLWYALLYSVERMLIESLRGDSLWLINGVVRVSQLLSFLIFAAVIVFFIVRHNREKKLGVLIWPDMDGTPLRLLDADEGAAEDTKEPSGENAEENSEESETTDTGTQSERGADEEPEEQEGSEDEPTMG